MPHTQTCLPHVKHDSRNRARRLVRPESALTDEFRLGCSDEACWDGPSGAGRESLTDLGARLSRAPQPGLAIGASDRVEDQQGGTGLGQPVAARASLQGGVDQQVVAVSGEPDGLGLREAADQPVTLPTIRKIATA